MTIPASSFTCGVCGAAISPEVSLAGVTHSCAPALLKRIEALEAWRAEVTADLETIAAFSAAHSERTLRILRAMQEPPPTRCTCSYDESEEMTRHAPLCALHEAKR